MYMCEFMRLCPVMKMHLIWFLYKAVLDMHECVCVRMNTCVTLRPTEHAQISRPCLP